MSSKHLFETPADRSHCQSFASMKLKGFNFVVNCWFITSHSYGCMYTWGMCVIAFTAHTTQLLKKILGSKSAIRIQQLHALKCKHHIYTHCKKTIEVIYASWHKLAATLWFRLGSRHLFSTYRKWVENEHSVYISTKALECAWPKLWCHRLKFYIALWLLFVCVYRIGIKFRQWINLRNAL